MAVALLASCGTPKEIVYFQDLSEGSTLKVAKSEPIKLKPDDQISIVVSCRDPQVASMFNLPYYTNMIGQGAQSSSGSSGMSRGMSSYTVDSQGDIDFPILGKIHVGGMTREEVTEVVKEQLVESRQIKDPVVTVEFVNLSFSVLGEVNNPGRYSIDRDHFSVLDAISLAGDLSIDGSRSNILLIRKEDNKDRTYTLNLLDAKQLYASPAFYVQQGDLIYVTPNDKRARESTVNGNTAYSASFWISFASFITSMTLFVFNILKMV